MLVKVSSKVHDRPMDFNVTVFKKVHLFMVSDSTFQLTFKKILLHTNQSGHHKQINKQQMLARLWRKGNPSTLLVGMQTGAATGKQY